MVHNTQWCKSACWYMENVEFGDAKCRVQAPARTIGLNIRDAYSNALMIAEEIIGEEKENRLAESEAEMEVETPQPLLEHETQPDTNQT